MTIIEQRKQAAKRRYLALADDLQSSDLNRVQEGSESKVERLKGHIPGSLMAIWGDIKVMADLVGSYASGRYRQIPWRSLAAISGALLYFVAPMDALPDIIPLAGYIDDAFIFKLVLDLVREDLEVYKRWLKSQGEPQQEAAERNLSDTK